jgi:hypothetical protein
MDIRGVIVTEAGERSNQSKTMKTDSNLSLANRKQLADLLGTQYNGLRQKAKDRYYERSNDLRNSLVDEIAEKKGALKLGVQIRVGELAIDELKEELSALGFLYDDGDVRLETRRSNLLNKTVDERVKKELGSPDDIDARFDSSQIAMMTVATLEDAEKLLKSVSSI